MKIMKKTVIALAIAALAAAGTSSAATVYNQDGTKVELGGSMRIFLGKLGENQRGNLVNDGSRINIKASQALENGLSAFAGYELRFERDALKNKQNAENDFGDPTTRKLFVGFGFENVGKLSFGRQSTTADDVVGDSLYYDSGALNPLITRADKSVKFSSAEFGGFSFGVDYLFGNAQKYTTNNRYKSGYQVGAFYNYEIADNHKFDAAAVYTVDQFDTQTSSETDQKNHTDCQPPRQRPHRLAAGGRLQPALALQRRCCSLSRCRSWLQQYFCREPLPPQLRRRYDAG